MSSLVLTIKSSESKDLNDQIMQLSSGNDKRIIQEAAGRVRDIATGFHSSILTIQTSSDDPIAASGTVTLANVSADDTITIGKTTLTAKASPSGENQFSQAGTDTVDAESLVAKINAHSVLSLIVSASNVAGVVTIVALQKGILGNHIALSSSDGTRLAVSASYLADGTGGVSSSGLVISAL